MTRRYEWVTRKGAATITGRYHEGHGERVVEAIRDRYDRENETAKVNRSGEASRVAMGTARAKGDGDPFQGDPHQRETLVTWPPAKVLLFPTKRYCPTCGSRLAPNGDVCISCCLPGGPAA